MGDRSRLLWRCRRGIREMDLLLETFVEHHYPGLDDDQQQLFERFLEESDLDILAWITGRSEPADPAYGPIIERLQQINTADTPDDNSKHNV
jgi:antitoxin CptB